MYTVYSKEEMAELVEAASKPKTPIRTESLIHQKKSVVTKIDIKSLARIGSVVKFDEGSVLFSQGDEGSDMFLILSGSVEVSDKNGVVATLEVGDMFGEMSLVDSLPRSATVTAVSQIDVLRLSRENFNDVVAHEPEIAFRVMQTLSKRIRLVNQTVFMLKNKGADEAIETEEPFEETEDENVDIDRATSN